MRHRRGAAPASGAPNGASDPPRPKRWRPRVEHVAIAVALSVVIAYLLLSAHDPLEPGPGEARLEVAGLAEVVRTDGTTEKIDGATLLRQEELVTVLKGSIRLVLASGAVLEGRTGWNGQGDTAVRIGDIPALLAGEVLAQASEGVTLAAADNEIDLASGGGAMRVARSLAVDVRTYSGVATLDSAGQRRSVPALRRLSLAVFGAPPARPRPLIYDRTDPWDRRFLADIMDLGDRLEAVASAYSRTMGTTERRGAAFFKGVLPELRDDDDFTEALVDPDRPPGETLVGAAITEFGQGGTFAERWTSVFAFRGDGAGWGLVAADQRARSEPLLKAISSALDDSPFGFDIEPPDDSSIDELALVLPPATDTPGSPAEDPDQTVGGTTSSGGEPGGSTASGGGATTSPTQPPSSPTAPALPPTSPPQTTLPPPPTLPPPTVPPTTLPPTTLPPPPPLPPPTLPPPTLPTLPAAPLPPP